MSNNLKKHKLVNADKITRFVCPGGTFQKATLTDEQAEILLKHHCPHIAKSEEETTTAAEPVKKDKNK